MKRRTVIGGSMALAAVGAGVGLSLWRSRPGLTDAETALWSSAFDQPGGGRLTMASLRGQPLLLNFWATWCPPCVKEMPLLDRFHQDHRAGGWRVVGLAVDAPAPVREYLARLPMSFPIGLAGMEGADLARNLGNISGGLPFTVVFGREGRVIGRKLGAVEMADLVRWDSETSKID